MKSGRSGRFWFTLLFVVISVAEGTPLLGAEQVSQLKAKHQAGQTFLTWEEVLPPVIPEAVSIVELTKIQRRTEKEKRVRYRVYRSKRPIASVEGLKPIAEVRPLTCWNTGYYGRYPKPHHKALRYVVEEGHSPVAPGMGIYVHNPPEAGKAYYAVTVVLHGQENTATGTDNALQTPVDETVGQGVPVLQRVVRPKLFNYVQYPTLYYYVRWEAPPNASVPSLPFYYVVAIPSGLAKPAPVGLHLHSWGGSLNKGYGWWYNAEKGAILIASNQIPYDWWTGYHELFWTGRPLRTKEDWAKGVVRAYSQKRMLAFLDWVATQWEVDLSRTFVAGSSMGGSGALMLAIRFPQRIAWAISWVGVHSPSMTPGFKNSYARVYGKPEWGGIFEDGTPVWDYFNDAWYLRRYPTKEVGFLTFSNGKNDSSIGWPQAVEFYQALQETKRPHLFVWGQKGHGQRAVMPRGKQRVMPIDIRTNQSLPAFTHGSLDDNPGNGDPTDGDASGQVNGYLYWETKHIVDETKRWEMTVGLVDRAPQNSSTVNITPRRCQKFTAIPGEEFKWTSTSLSDNKVRQFGQAVADRWGLVTLERVRVDKGKTRITITKKLDETK